MLQHTHRDVAPLRRILLPVPPSPELTLYQGATKGVYHEVAKSREGIGSDLNIHMKPVVITSQLSCLRLCYFLPTYCLQK